MQAALRADRQHLLGGGAGRVEGLGRLGMPEEVASAVAVPASDEATYVTGETLGVSGGLGMV